MSLRHTGENHQLPLTEVGGDLIMLGGKVFTADPDMRWVEALAIRRGRVIARGSTKQIKRFTQDWKSARIVDLEGRVVIPRLNEAHIPMRFDSDGPMNPFLGIMAAVLHPANPGEAVSVADAVRAYTAGSAMVEGKADHKGMLAPGHVADCAVLSQDIFTVHPSRLPETRSVMTVVDGQVIHEAEAWSQHIQEVMK